MISYSWFATPSYVDGARKLYGMERCKRRSNEHRGEVRASRIPHNYCAKIHPERGDLHAPSLVRNCCVRECLGRASSERSDLPQRCGTIASSSLPGLSPPRRGGADVAPPIRGCP